MYQLKIKSHFDAAHKLNDYVGACSRLHGHRWEVIFAIGGTKLDNCGMLLDFKEAKKIIDNILPDHQYLNEKVDFNPTAENLSKHLYELMSKELHDINKDLKLNYIELFESPECSCIFINI